MEVLAEALKDDGSPCWMLTPGIAVKTVPIGTIAPLVQGTRGGTLQDAALLWLESGSLTNRTRHRLFFAPCH